MKIGLTYDLRSDYLAEGYSLEETAEFDKPDTIEGIELALRSLGYETERIGNVRQLATRLVLGERWDLVFNIAEGLYGLGREALVPALLDTWRIPYTFSDPLVLSLTLHKGVCKRVVRDLGIPTADFAIVDEPADIDGIRLPYPLFVKPAAEGTGKGIDAASRVETPAQLRRMCLSLLERFRQPVLVETYLPGREFTVGLVGTGREAQVVGMMEVILQAAAEPGGYSYLNKEHYEGRVSYEPVDGPLADRVGAVALAAWRGLGCRDGGRVDIRLDGDGVPNFIEVNPLAGLNPVHSDLPILCRMRGIEYDELIARIMHSALRRVEAPLRADLAG